MLSLKQQIFVWSILIKMLESRRSHPIFLSLFLWALDKNWGMSSLEIMQNIAKLIKIGVNGINKSWCLSLNWSYLTFAVQPNLSLKKGKQVLKINVVCFFVLVVAEFWISPVPFK